MVLHTKNLAQFSQHRINKLLFIYPSCFNGFANLMPKHEGKRNADNQGWLDARFGPTTLQRTVTLNQTRKQPPHDDCSFWQLLKPVMSYFMAPLRHLFICVST